MDTNYEIINQINQYYSDKIIQFGAIPQGVDWNSKDGQCLRFEQLCKIINTTEPFSLNDLGCGYGALFDFVLEKFQTFSYLGVDISSEMTDSAKNLYQDYKNAQFMTSDRPEITADFGIASGIFNVRQNRTDSEWIEHIKATLDVLDQTSRLGFSFNCLTSYSDEDKKQDYLYYANPCELFDLCKQRYSRQVALLHDYGLYEFTILVRKM